MHEQHTPGQQDPQLRSAGAEPPAFEDAPLMRLRSAGDLGDEPSMRLRSTGGKNALAIRRTTDDESLVEALTGLP